MVGTWLQTTLASSQSKNKMTCLRNSKKASVNAHVPKRTLKKKNLNTDVLEDDNTK